MKKQLYLLFLLLLSVQLVVAQTTRYEYWLDNGYDGRTVVADNVDAVSLNLDISTITPGLHFFNFRAQGDSERWGSLSRFLFFKREEADSAVSMAQYEYWLDNQHEMRTTVEGGTSEVLLNLDISSIKPGLHYLNFRAQGKSGHWGGLSRYLFFMREEADSTAISMAQYEYWLDNNYGGRKIVKGSYSEIPLDIDINSLKPGLHYFNVRAQGKSGQWGGLSRYLFFIKDGIGQLAHIEYWLDERQDVITQQVTDSTVVITRDISNLTGGDHTFYMEGVTSDGSRCMVNGYEFNVEFAPEPENPRISLQEVPFRSYTGWGVDAQVVGAANCAWYLNESTGIPYGDGSVINRADLSHFSKLIVVATEGTPRFLFNRDMDEGLWNENEEESHLIEYPKEGWSEKYFTKETTTDGDVYTVDLKQIKNDKGFVYLHAIKGANWTDVTLSSMEVELDGNPEVSITVDGDGIVGWSTPTDVGEVGNSQNELFAVEYNSEVKLTFTPNTGYRLLHVFVNDVNDYVDQVSDNSLSLHITQYSNIRVVFEMDTNKIPLTADMFYDWDGWGPLAQIIGEGYCKYELGEPSEIPYGDPNVRDYVDLSSYSRLEVTVEEGTPRFLFNRVCENGLWNNNEAESHLIEYPNEGWASKYFIQSGNVWSVDLKQMVADKGFAHLHAIKAPWNTEITVTKMELVENGDIVLPEAYAVPSEGNTALTFYYDTNKSSHEGAVSVVPFSSGGSRGWDSYASNITKVEFDKSFANCLTLTSMANWFMGCNNLATINGTRYIKTSEVTDMQQMFFGCSSLTSLDLSSFNTAKVSTMLQMFFGCSALTTVYVGSGWSLENMSYDGAVFEGCTSLVGGYGTVYDAGSIDYTYAHIDEGSSNPGYLTGREPLTNEMLLEWDGFGIDAQKKYVTAGAYILGMSVEMPYGDPNVVDFADLSPYSRLEVLVTAGTPRFLFNRDETDGQPSENEEESHMIDSDHEGCMTWASKYFSSETKENGILWIVNLKQMVQDKGFAHLHAIKGANDANVTVTKMDLVIAQNQDFNPEPYAVLSNENTKLTFYYDNLKAGRNGMGVGPFVHTTYNSETDVSDVDGRGWNDAIKSITKVEFDNSFKDCNSLTSTAYWFYNMNALKSITGIQNLNTENVRDMSCMFYYCRALESLDVSHFNTGNVTNMYYMFIGCNTIKSLDVSGFNTSKVTDMNSMFEFCSSLENIDVSNFNTESVTNMSAMFGVCPHLTTLDLSSFDTHNVRSFNQIFASDSLLTTIYVNPSKWSLEAAMGNEWNTKWMFLDCLSLTGGKGTAYDAEYTDYTYAHIDGGTSNPGYFTDKNAPVIEATFDGRVLAVGGSTTMTDALESVGGRDKVAKTITAIVWNSSAALANSDLTDISNPNMLIYVPSESQAPQNRDNVVIGNDSTGYTAKNVVLTDVVEGNGNFYCPKEFTAEMISYTHEYRQTTEVGVSRGWETIAMPFNVQTVMHEKQGLIAPFGNSTSKKHFWLRHISTAGQTHSLAQATTIEANMPYLISMPNSDAYPDEYNLAGRVTFSSQNVPVMVTDIFPVHMSSGNGGMLMFVPCFQTQQVHEMVYALNVGEARDGYPEGSVFEANYREIRPFEAYTVHEGNSPAPQFIPVSDFVNSNLTGIEELRFEDVNVAQWYDLNGRKLQKKPTQKGVYLLNGRKVVMR